MVMKMLYSGGVDVFADTTSGFEAEAVLGLPRKSGFLSHCAGKAVKVLDPHRHILPHTYSYDFVWLDRDQVDQAQSQIKFMREMGVRVEPGSVPRIIESLRRDRPRALKILESYEGAKIMKLNFRHIILNPQEAALRLKEIVPSLDVERAAAAVVRRTPRCHPSMMEHELAA